MRLMCWLLRPNAWPAPSSLLTGTNAPSTLSCLLPKFGDTRQMEGYGDATEILCLDGVAVDLGMSGCRSYAGATGGRELRRPSTEVLARRMECAARGVSERQRSRRSRSGWLFACAAQFPSIPNQLASGGRHPNGDVRQGPPCPTLR